LIELLASRKKPGTWISGACSLEFEGEKLILKNSDLDLELVLNQYGAQSGKMFYPVVVKNTNSGVVIIDLRPLFFVSRNQLYTTQLGNSYHQNINIINQSYSMRNLFLESPTVIISEFGVDQQIKCEF